MKRWRSNIRQPFSLHLVPTRLSTQLRRSTRLIICAMLSVSAALPGLAGIGKNASSQVLDLGAAVNYPVGAFPSSILVNDFNNDGKLDLVTANYDSDNLSILLGNGDGTLQAAVNYPVVCFSPQSLAAGDFNGDGKLDLATVDNRCANLSMLLGNGNGTFQNAISYGIVACPIWVVTGDFNRDGKLDLVIGTGELCLAKPGKGDAKVAPSLNGVGVNVAIGNGDGTFQSLVTYPTGTTPSQAVVGDFNRDGKLDLAVTAVNGNSVKVLIGNGNGSFQSGIDYPVGAFPASLTMADFNHDGKLDLAVANASTSVSLLLGNGNGTFQSAINYTTGDVSYTISAGDVNGDGHPDLVTANTFSNTLSVLLGNGDGTLQPPVIYAVGTRPHAVTSGDFNGKGKLDLASVNSFSNTVSILLNCADSMSVASASQFFMMNGGPGNVQMRAPNGCGWTAASNNNWITLTSADSGNGNDTVTFEVRENFTGSARQGSLLIGGATFTVIQDGGLGDDCEYSIFPLFEAFSASGGSGTVNVSAAERCAWQATSDVNWVTFTSASSGIGGNSVSYAVAANPGATGRKGIISVAGKTFTVKQKGN